MAEQEKHAAPPGWLPDRIRADLDFFITHLLFDSLEAVCENPGRFGDDYLIPLGDDLQCAIQQLTAWRARLLGADIQEVARG